jgi:hypothetical protein
MFFFEKKNQKTFVFWSARLKRRETQRNKSLLLLFFRKEGLSSFA